ncbi:hypothetical protein G6F57_007583 [Rhizopus arrhizus]|jgi:hypothetical protein|uniref:Uncharacterized protein n=3 Tax=Rhizopus TaxID=4842 RepID=I1CFA3_RHIO9|nr:hypothetical protein RO3G_11844 [Rhizopus delemar RA 99-880]KAG0738964.1 hypothetical protein G6F23_009288 [Rhizopus arrhizus]KAG1052053.1 hypothetical protein G6F43_005788 [Rhizopus delemar]KAG0756430.1 hypothetical protein G6F24_011158 [Rhizopus arrhizus]KAG0783315.1 hypothetical protein G6F21_010609 [Rhizopus arrhizus]|eukprot:EIE87133.1 hypothetical protein RO3G_11844 [Rhizopus delemar RA 99-880]
MNTHIAPDNSTSQATSYVGSNSDPVTAAEHGEHTQTPPGHTSGGNHVMQDIKSTMHNIKQSAKETFQRDHHHGQDYEKRPQDGKTNPME